MALKRELSFVQATALNMIDMVGIGPFVTTSLVAATMGSFELVLLAWIVGAVLSFMDACVWSELGAKMPEAGGTYAFLKETYKGYGFGRLLTFLFIWQTTFQAPLVITSGAQGFARYLQYVLPMNDLQMHISASCLVVVITFLLYRRIGDVGKISVGLSVVVVLTILWIILSSMFHVPGSMFHVPSATFHVPSATFQGLSSVAPGTWYVALGAASISTMYSYLGYYNICHLGAEVRNPEKVIPRSMMMSIAGIAVLYLAMQSSIFSVLPINVISNSKFVVSVFIESLYGSPLAQFATVLVLVIAVSSLFSVMLGYTRIPYAAAKDGLFFKVFSREHPKHNFPHVSLLVLGALGIVFSFFLTIEDAIKSIITMRIFTQFISQAVGLMLYRKQVGAQNMPWRMWLYPVPVVLSMAGWLWIFASAKPTSQIAGLVTPMIGIAVFYLTPGIRNPRH